MRPALVLAAAVLGACAPPTASQVRPGDASAPSPAPRFDLARIARAVHERTNAERTRLGLSVLLWRDDLARLAAVHSDDMAARDFFAHEGPDGRDVNARAEALGMTCRFEVGRTVYTGFSENLFQTWTYRGWRDESDGVTTTRTYDYRAETNFAPEIVTGWMNSPGHRVNLLEPRSRAEGIAVALRPDGKMFITQVFC